MLAAWIVLLSAAVTSLPPSPPLHYRLELKGSLRFEGGAADTAGRNGDASAVVFLTATMRDSAGGRIAHVVIDSATCMGSGVLSMAFDSSVARRSRGAWFDVALVGGARNETPEASIRNPLTGRVAPALRMLFAPHHPALGPKVAFADTIDVLASSQRWKQRTPTVTRWKVTEYDSAHAVLDGEVSGVATVTGQVLASGLVIGHRTIVLAADGTVQRSVFTTSQQTLLAPQDNSAIYRAVGTTTGTVTLLPEQP
ncbi:MAG: hypothetical protein ACREL5_03980 [Gemmatimonadales bacterium]